MKPISVIANSSLAVTDAPELPPGGGVSGNETYSMRLWRLGRRINRKDDALLTLGHFTFELDLNQNPIGKPLTERRNLSLTEATLKRTLTFQADIELEELTFVVRNQPILALQRSVTNRGNRPAAIKATFTYAFDGADGHHEQPPQGVNVNLLHTGISCGFFDYQADTIRPADGLLSLKTTQPNVKPQTQGNTIAFHIQIPLEPQASKSIAFFIFPCDQNDAPNYMGMAYQLKNSLRAQAFQQLRKEHLLSWQNEWKKVDLILPNPRLVTIYRAAIYHLLCVAKPQAGIPDGLSNLHNQARFSGINELFAVDALLHAGFTQAAKQPVAFRRRTLNQANATPNAHRLEANFPLYADETGAPAGQPTPWPATYVIHNAHIALAAWQVAQFTQDDDFLRTEAYPILRAVAQLFVHAVTTSHTRPYIPGDDCLNIIPCIDFPGNGTYTTTPMGTGYAVAATLEAATQAAIRLHKDQEIRTTWSSQARRLLKTLNLSRQAQTAEHHDGLRTCACLANVFPYYLKHAESQTELKLLNNLRDHLIHGPGPDGTPPTCPWNAAWMAALAARLGQADMAEQAILAAAQAADHTGQLPRQIHPDHATTTLPWFMPAQTTYVIALTLMLIQSDSRELQLLPATPTHWRDLDVTLPASGGLLVTFKVRNLSLTKLSITNQTTQNARRIITLPPHIILPQPLNPTKSYSIPPQDTIRII